MTLQNLAQQGRYSRYDTMAAGVSSKILNIRKEIVQISLSNFENQEHRLEYVLSVHGIEFINDSKASNVNATWYALETMMKPVVWIVGGHEGKIDYAVFKDVAARKIKAIICLDKNEKFIKKAFKNIVKDIKMAENMKEAVAYAYKYGKNGDAVLLSPACASFDMYENYEDRGRQFKRCVREL